MVSVAPEGRVILGGPDSDLRRALASAIRADGCDVIMVQARRLGASGVFAAPVDVDVLKRAVRAAMPR